jgi:hypothetical protein
MNAAECFSRSLFEERPKKCGLPSTYLLYFLWDPLRKKCGGTIMLFAVRQVRDRISARHPREGPLPSGSYEETKSGTRRVIYIFVCMLD